MQSTLLASPGLGDLWWALFLCSFNIFAQFLHLLYNSHIWAKCSTFNNQRIHRVLATCRKSPHCVASLYNLLQKLKVFESKLMLNPTSHWPAKFCLWGRHLWTSTSHSRAIWRKVWKLIACSSSFYCQCEFFVMCLFSLGQFFATGLFWWSTKYSNVEADYQPMWLWYYFVSRTTGRSVVRPWF